jgi:DNA-binding XRE family transcriptional regulator
LAGIAVPGELREENYEKGRYSRSLKVALKIAHAFCEPVERVFWFRDSA